MALRAVVVAGIILATITCGARAQSFSLEAAEGEQRPNVSRYKGSAKLKVRGYVIVADEICIDRVNPLVAVIGNAEVTDPDGTRLAARRVVLAEALSREIVTGIATASISLQALRDINEPDPRAQPCGSG